MNAVVLAAGDGGRLRPLTDGIPKPLVDVGGRPLIDHVLDALASAGVEDVAIVLGYRGAQIRRHVQSSPRAMRLRFVDNPAYESGNAASLWSARGAFDGPFVLAMADHLVEFALVQRLASGAAGRCRLAVDSADPDDPRAREATLALVHDGRVIDLGKSLPRWNALDTGVFWCTPDIFDAMAPRLRSGEAGAAFAVLARDGRLDAVDVTGLRWIDVDTPDDLSAAEAWVAAAEPLHGEVA